MKITSGFAIGTLLPGLAAALILASCSTDTASERETTPSEDVFLISQTLDWQGHRGARGLLPENSIPSYRLAAEMGVTTVEIDVVMSSDGRVVVSHEPWMSEVICSHPDGRPVSEEEAHDLNIYTMTYEQVAAFDCGSRGHPGFPHQEAIEVAKPLLGETLANLEAYSDSLSRPPLHYNVEIKSRPEHDGVYHPDVETFAGAVYDVLAEQGVLARSTVQSFDPRTVDAIRHIDPDVTVALLVSNEDGLDANLARLSELPDIYSPNQNLVDSTLVSELREKGLRLIPWTVNTTADMRRLIDLGVDGIITDYPDSARTVANSNR